MEADRQGERQEENIRNKNKETETDRRQVRNAERMNRDRILSVSTEWKPQPDPKTPTQLPVTLFKL